MKILLQTVQKGIASPAICWRKFFRLFSNSIEWKILWFKKQLSVLRNRGFWSWSRKNLFKKKTSVWESKLLFFLYYPGKLAFSESKLCQPGIINWSFNFHDLFHFAHRDLAIKSVYFDWFILKWLKTDLKPNKSSDWRDIWGIYLFTLSYKYFTTECFLMNMKWVRCDFIFLRVVGNFYFLFNVLI